jgi:hypothetical protein
MLLGGGCCRQWRGTLCFLFVSKKAEVGWRRHLSVGGGSQKGGSGNRPSQENKGYNYHLRVVHERSRVDCPIQTLGSTNAPGWRSSLTLRSPIVDPWLQPTNKNTLVLVQHVINSNM